MTMNGRFERADPEGRVTRPNCSSKRLVWKRVVVVFATALAAFIVMWRPRDLGWAPAVSYIGTPPPRVGTSSPRVERPRVRQTVSAPVVLDGQSVNQVVAFGPDCCGSSPR